MSTGFSDSARKPNDDGDHVSKGRKGDKEVQPTHGTAIAEDFVEKQSSGGELRAFKFLFGH